MHPVEHYLAELAHLRRAGAGVDELSGYPALKTLLDEVGSTTKPKVRTIMNLRNTGAGLPDGGLFTATQFKGKAATQPRDPSRPDVAAIEVKGTAADINAVIASEQVNGYLTRYGQVLVTNYRQFVLMVERDGSARKADEFSLAETDAAFWSDVAGRLPRYQVGCNSISMSTGSPTFDLQGRAGVQLVRTPNPSRSLSARTEPISRAPAL